MENKWIPISIIILAASILISSFYLGSSLKAVKQIQYISAESNNVSNKSEDILSITEAASFLNLTEGRIEDLVKTSELYSGDLAIPHYSINGEVRFSKKALTEWLVTLSKYKLEI